MVTVSLGKAAATAMTSADVSNEHAERAAADAVPGADEGTWPTAVLRPAEDAGFPCPPEECVAPAGPQPAGDTASSANPAADRMRVIGISYPMRIDDHMERGPPGYRF